VTRYSCSDCWYKALKAGRPTPEWGLTVLCLHLANSFVKIGEGRSIAGTGSTARCRCKFRYVGLSNSTRLQRHRAVSLPQYGFLVYISETVSVTIQMLKLHKVAYADFHSRDAKSRRWQKITSRRTRHTTKIGKSHYDCDREYVIITGLINTGTCSRLYVHYFARI